MKKVILFLLIFSTACVSMTKKPILMSDVKKLEEGKTKKSFLLSLYGPPQKETMSGNFLNQCFYYSGGRFDRKEYFLFLQFDNKDNLVSKYFNDNRAISECSSVSPLKTSASGRGSTRKRCFMDIDCGVASKCIHGVCTGGIGPKIGGQCVSGNYGKKVCSNNGRKCFNNANCF